MSAAPGDRLADAEARRRIREELDTTFVVEAAAGTGKTTALVERIVATVRAGRATLDAVAAVTFTDKAAGEMKLRLREALERERSAAPVGTGRRQRLDEALAALEATRIATIHAFCADLLRERPLQAGIDPAFEVLPDDEAEQLLDRAFDGWFEEALERPGPGLRRVLKRGAWRRDGRDGPRRVLRDAVRTLDEWRDHPTPWSRPPFDRDAAIDAVVERAEALRGLAARAYREDNVVIDLRAIEAWLDEQAARERVRGRDHDALEGALVRLARRSTRRRKGFRGERFGEGLARAEVLERRAALDGALDRFVTDAEADLAPLLREELEPVVERFAELKRRAGRLDFLDLLVRTRALLGQDRDVRRELQQRFRRIFVDEFQDTDPLQAEVLLLLAADDPAASDPATVRVTPGKLFVVGDPKQSIYRFRRADVATYERVARRLVSQGAERLHLRTSFRGVPGIQAAVNHAFAPVMRADPDGAQAAYVALEPSRPERGGRPAVVALPVPEPYGRWGVYKNAVADSTPGAVAAFVHWLVTDSGWTVREPGAPDDAPEVPIAPRHVCLLFKRMQSWGKDVTRGYVRGLEARRVPHVLVGGRSFHEREEVSALHSVLRAIEWPDDALSVYATLRGPFLGFDDGTLLAWRHGVGPLHPMRPATPPPADAELAQVADALGLLAELHRLRNRRPVAETLHRFLVAVRAHAAVAIWPTGEQSLANVLHLVDEARRFEQRRPTSFRGFVDWLAGRAERGATGEAPIVEEGAEGVRIMTVHKAKGLEFPVVVLCDPTAPRRSDRPSRFLDPDRALWAAPIAGCAPRELTANGDRVLRADEAEVLRTTYVAATRARDLLVVPAVGDGPIEGWVDVLHPALYPEPDRRRDAAPAPGCPPFGDDSVRARHPEAEGARHTSVRPGLHRIAEGVEVVWWDPATLDLDVEPRGGVRQRELLVEEGGGDARARWAEAWRAWSARDAALRASGATPTVRTVTVTRAAQEGWATGDGEVQVERTAAPRAGRPGGRRFGELVHAVLAAVPFSADREAIARMATAVARWVGAPAPEVDAAVGAVEAALAHPLLRRAAAATRVHRELPLTFRDAGGVLREGVADLVFEEKRRDSWVVVDYKTDGAAGSDVYRSQLLNYREALEKRSVGAVELVLFEV